MRSRVCGRDCGHYHAFFWFYLPYFPTVTIRPYVLVRRFSAASGLFSFYLPCLPPAQLLSLLLTLPTLPYHILLPPVAVLPVCRLTPVTVWVVTCLSFILPNTFFQNLLLQGSWFRTLCFFLLVLFFLNNTGLSRYFTVHAMRWMSNACVHAGAVLWRTAGTCLNALPPMSGALRATCTLLRRRTYFWRAAFSAIPAFSVACAPYAGSGTLCWCVHAFMPRDDSAGRCRLCTFPAWRRTALPMPITAPRRMIYLCAYGFMPLRTLLLYLLCIDLLLPVCHGPSVSAFLRCAPAGTFCSILLYLLYVLRLVLLLPFCCVLGSAGRQVDFAILLGHLFAVSGRGSFAHSLAVILRAFPARHHCCRALAVLFYATAVLRSAVWTAPGGT